MSGVNVGPEYPNKPPGWFSRRHSTGEQHAEAVASHATRNERRSEAEERQASVQHERTKAHRLGRCGCEAAS